MCYSFSVGLGQGLKHYKNFALFLISFLVDTIILLYLTQWSL
jgi:hypothetical protein